MALIDDLLAADGCVASVYLRAPSDTADAAHQLATRWKNARRDLEQAAAPDAVLASVDRVLGDFDHGDAAAIACFAAEDGLVRVALLDDELATDRATYDTLPRLVPLIASQQRSVPHVMVMTDRAGADIFGIVDGSEQIQVGVEGDVEHIHRGHPGGWSQRRFQQRAENTWESNAKECAQQVADTARSISARVITVAGDERASHLLVDALDADVRDKAVLLDVGDPDAVADATVRAAADVVARDTTAILADLRDRDGTGTATRDLDEVLHALSNGRVDTLLVNDDVDDDRRGYFAPDDTPVCTRQKSFEDMREGRLVDVAVRSAVRGDARIRIVPPSAVEPDGLAALLRW